MLAMKRMSLLASGSSTETTSLERDVARYKEESEKVRRSLVTLYVTHLSHRKSWMATSTLCTNTSQTRTVRPKIQASKTRWASCLSNRQSRRRNRCSIYILSCFGILEFYYPPCWIYGNISVCECSLKIVRKRLECVKQEIMRVSTTVL